MTAQRTSAVMISQIWVLETVQQIYFPIKLDFIKLQSTTTIITAT